jgi:hypothetical protein
MHVAVLGTGFAFGISVFFAWLLVMLHHDRAHRRAGVEASQARVAGQRRAALTAHAPAARAATVPVARAGSFCRVAGNIGHTKHGVVLVCESNGHGRPRWRRTDVFRAA